MKNIFIFGPYFVCLISDMMEASFRSFYRNSVVLPTQEKEYNKTNKLSSNNSKNATNHGEQQLYHGSGLCPRKSV